MVFSNIKKWVVVAGLTCFMPIASHAISLTLDNAIGYIVPGVSASAAEDNLLVTALLANANGISTSVSGCNFVVATPGSYPTPAVEINTGAVGGDDMVNLGAGGYAYLMVKYDGANGSAIVWDVSSYTGNVVVPDKDVNNKTHNNYALFNAASSSSVPDGGMTAALLGFGLVGFSFLSRRKA